MGNSSCSTVPVEPGRKVKPLLELLRAAGGVTKAPDAESNKDFLKEMDATFPELAIYKQGRIQTSPGVEEISGSPTEYYSRGAQSHRECILKRHVTYFIMCIYMYLSQALIYMIVPFFFLQIPQIICLKHLLPSI